jgi:hypothetical protein
MGYGDDIILGLYGLFTVFHTNDGEAFPIEINVSIADIDNLKAQPVNPP